MKETKKPKPIPPRNSLLSGSLSSLSDMDVDDKHDPMNRLCMNQDKFLSYLKIISCKRPLAFAKSTNLEMQENFTIEKVWTGIDKLYSDGMTKYVAEMREMGEQPDIDYKDEDLRKGWMEIHGSLTLKDENDDETLKFIGRLGLRDLAKYVVGRPIYTLFAACAKVVLAERNGHPQPAPFQPPFFQTVYEHYMPVQDAFRDAVNEQGLRSPMDALLTTFRNELLGDFTISGECGERDVAIVSPPDDFEHPTGQILRADSFSSISHRFTSRLTNKQKMHRSSLISWGSMKLANDIAEIPLLAVEYKLLDIMTAENQITAALLPAGAVMRLLGLRFPVYGIAVSKKKSVAYSVTAELTDSKLDYTVVRLREWSSLHDVKDFVDFVDFLHDHHTWFKNNVMKYVYGSWDPDNGWDTVECNKIKPWAKAI